MMYKAKPLFECLNFYFVAHLVYYFGWQLRYLLCISVV